MATYQCTLLGVDDDDITGLGEVPFELDSEHDPSAFFTVGLISLPQDAEGRKERARKTAAAAVAWLARRGGQAELSEVTRHLEQALDRYHAAR